MTDIAEWDQHYDRSIDQLQAQLDQVREVYEYMRQTIPQKWAPIMIVEKLAAILEDDEAGTTLSPGVVDDWPASDGFTPEHGWMAS